MAPPRIALIGGNGFLGRHLAVWLGNAGVGCAVLSRTIDRGFFQRHAPDAELFVTGELSTKSLQRELAKTDCAVYVANTAFPSGGPHSVVDELNVNVDTALTYFETLSRLDPAPTIIYISSGGTVYGNTEHSDTVSETQRLAPTSTYGVGKVLIEESLRFLCRTTRIRGRILRLSNTVGEWNRRMDQGLVPLTIRCLLNGEPLTVLGIWKKYAITLTQTTSVTRSIALPDGREMIAALYGISDPDGACPFAMLSILSRLPLNGALKSNRKLPASWMCKKSSLTLKRLRKNLAGYLQLILINPSSVYGSILQTIVA